MSKKVSEKSLELNVGTELLNWLRGPMKMPKAYLRGLTQQEERREGADFFANLPGDIRIFAFQFKAPRGPIDGLPYKFTLSRNQHEALHKLAVHVPEAVHYVLPFYVLTDKLIQDVPHLAQDTWLLPVAPMDTATVFSGQKTKRVHCYPGVTCVNPEYEMKKLSNARLSWEAGVKPGNFAEWYSGLRRYKQESSLTGYRMSPMIVRGMRIVIIGQHDNDKAES